MARSTSKRLISRDLLESLSRPELAKMLQPFALFCQARRIDLAALAASTAPEGVLPLYEVLTKGDAALPADLQLAVADLREVAEAGHDDFYRIATERGLPPPPMGLTPGNLALAMYLEQPELFRCVRVRLDCSTAASFVEYEAATEAPLRRATSDEIRARLQSLIGAWFASRNRTEFCEVWVTESAEEIFFEITHCETPKTQGELDTASMTRKQRTFIATRRDHVLADKATGRLAVQARYANEKDLYRRVFGDVFHGDGAHYVARDLLSFAAIVEQGAAALPADPALGVESVVVRHLRARRDDGLDMQLTHPEGIFAAITPDALRALVSGNDVKQAALVFELAGREKALRVHLARPNRVVMDRSDGAAERAVRGYLVSRGVLAVPRREQTASVESVRGDATVS